jgi:hypothetical protein
LDLWDNSEVAAEEQVPLRPKGMVEEGDLTPPPDGGSPLLEERGKRGIEDRDCGGA